MTLKGTRLTRAFVLLLYFCATLQFIRFYARTTDFYLRLPEYLSGHERMPFQERILPVFLLNSIFSSPWLMRQLSHPNGAISWSRAPFYLISLAGFGAAALNTQLLYRAVSRRHSLGILVFPVLLFTVMWTYTVHVEANFSYPYDMLSLAFFTAGLLFIYTRRFLPLLAVIAVGTWNRETTLFLIAIFVLDTVSKDVSVTDALQQRFQLSRMPWFRAGLLFAIWLGIKLWLAHRFAGNDESENYIRIGENIGRLKLRLVPALLNICGYLFPIVAIFWRRIQPERFGNYVWICVPWFLIMFYTGVILETRIYGELCSYTAVSLVLLVESRAAASESISPPAKRPSIPVSAEARSTHAISV